jgi:hypothetical protein
MEFNKAFCLTTHVRAVSAAYTICRPSQGTHVIACCIIAVGQIKLFFKLQSSDAGHFRKLIRWINFYQMLYPKAYVTFVETILIFNKNRQKRMGGLRKSLYTNFGAM